MDSLENEIQQILDQFIATPIPSRVEEALQRGYCRILNYDLSEDESAFT